MTKKSLPAAIIAAAVLLLAAPKFIGLGIRNATVNNLLTLVPAESRNQLRIEEREFSNGWFSSHALLEIQYAPAGPDAVSLGLEFDISHGPFLHTGEGYGIGLAHAAITPRLEEPLRRQLEELSFTLPPVSINLITRFDRSLRVNMDIAPLEYEAGGRRLHFGGLNGVLQATTNRSAQLHVVLNGLQASDNRTGIGYSLGAATLSSSAEDMSNLLAGSATELSLRELSGSGVGIGELRAHSRLRPAAGGAGKIDMLQQFFITDITGNTPLSTLSWESEMLGLDGEILRRYPSLVSGLQSQTPLNRQTAQFIVETGLLLIHSPLTFNNQIDAIAYGGDHALILDMDWVGLPDIDNLSDLDRDTLIKALTIKLDLSLELNALLQSPGADLIDAYAREGYILVDGGRVRSRASLSGGKLILNDEMVPLERFF